MSNELQENPAGYRWLAGSQIRRGNGSQVGFAGWLGNGDRRLDSGAGSD